MYIQSDSTQKHVLYSLLLNCRKRGVGSRSWKVKHISTLRHRHERKTSAFPCPHPEPGVLHRTYQKQVFGCTGEAAMVTSIHAGFFNPSQTKHLIGASSIFLSPTWATSPTASGSELTPFISSILLHHIPNMFRLL